MTKIKQVAARMVFGLACLVATGVAQAQYELAEMPFFDTPTGTLGLGGGLRLFDDLYKGTDEDKLVNYDLVPLYLYNGKHLFARGTAAGAHFVRNENVEFNLLLRWRFERLDPTLRDGFEGLTERKQTLDGGLELRLEGALGQLNLSYLTDTLDRHNGQTAEASYFLHIKRGNVTISPFVGWRWYSDDLANYYYGVSELEAAEGRPAYTPGEAHWLTTGVNTSWQVSRRGVLFANIGLGAVDTAISNSPIVDSSTQPVIFAGGTYDMGNLTNPGSDISPARQGEWSWRVNYGFAAEGNFFGGIDQGEFEDSSWSQGNMGGITLSRLFREGRRADLYAKFAVFRHFESGDGNSDFFSYAAYLNITGKGYAKWSDEELFRYGLGYGISYANDLPIHEERKQGFYDENTSLFMTYLELQLDFPLRNLFKTSNALRNCYAGVTVTHRSGIWGHSSAFSNVDGGANWITGALECKVGG